MVGFNIDRIRLIFATKKPNHIKRVYITRPKITMSVRIRPKGRRMSIYLCVVCMWVWLCVCVGYAYNLGSDVMVLDAQQKSSTSRKSRLSATLCNTYKYYRCWCFFYVFRRPEDARSCVFYECKTGVRSIGQMPTIIWLWSIWERVYIYTIEGELWVVVVHMIYGAMFV